MAAEALAHCGEHLLGEGVLLARAEAGVERGGERLGRHRLLDRRHHGPAALARILDMAGEARELAVAGERRGGEVEEPGGDDAAAPPDLGDVGEVEGEAVPLGELRRAGVLQDVEALGHRLHHAVLDAIVDHLDEMAGAARPGMEVALLHPRVVAVAAAGRRDVAAAGRERPEDRVEPPHGRRLAADHQAVAALEPPHPAARADIEIMQTLLAERGGPAHVVLPEGVAAVDDRVAGREQAGERLDCAFRGGPGRQHHPHRAGRVERRDEPGKVLRRPRPLAGERPPRRRIAVMHDAVMPGPHQPPHDVAPHPAKADDAELHGDLLGRFAPGTRFAGNECEPGGRCQPTRREEKERHPFEPSFPCVLNRLQSQGAKDPPS